MYTSARARGSEVEAADEQRYLDQHLPRADLEVIESSVADWAILNREGDNMKTADTSAIR